MTPFGERVRQLRRERGLLLKDMAAHLGVSSAYLSALERGERGKPTWTLVQGVLQYFRIIWDEADELVRLADLSEPKVKLDVGGRSARAVLFANRLAREFGALSDEDIAALLAVLDQARARKVDSGASRADSLKEPGPEGEADHRALTPPDADAKAPRPRLR